jgi:organic radical activating enzyme
VRPTEIISAWGKVLGGKTPLLSIEITRECPLHCPGCYAYSDGHLGGLVNLRDLSDLRDDALIDGVLKLVDRHDALQVTLVGGEPLVRARELGKLLPILSARGVFTMVVSSGVIPIPSEWTELPRVTIAISVDGLPEHHDVRRKPATYERILRNISGRSVYIHWTVVRSHVENLDYVRRYLSFWSARQEVHRIWMSVYTPQKGEESPEMLTQTDRMRLTEGDSGAGSRISEISNYDRNGASAPASSRVPWRVCLCTRVRQLHGRPAHASTTLRIRRESGLLAVRLCDQFRAALDHKPEARPSSSTRPVQRVAGIRRGNEPAAASGLILFRRQFRQHR